MTVFERIHQKAFHLLEKELPSFLTYHDPLHSAYVLQQAEFIALQENVTSEKDLFLIKVSAVLHDIGFIVQYKNHEEAGCEIAAELLKEFSFNNADIELVKGMIMATKIPQSPRTLNERIIADADLEYLGTDLFHSNSQLLFRELHYLDPKLNEETFRMMQIDFLSKHKYHTEYCIQNKEGQKQRYLKELKQNV